MDKKKVSVVPINRLRTSRYFDCLVLYFRLIYLANVVLNPSILQKLEEHFYLQYIL